MTDKDKLKDNKYLNATEFEFAKNFFVERFNLTHMYTGKLAFSLEELKKYNLPVRTKKAENYMIYGNNKEVYIFVLDKKFHAHYFLCLDTIVIIPGVIDYFDQTLPSKIVKPTGNNLTFEFVKPNITILTIAELEVKNYNDLKGIKVFKDHDNWPIRILSLYNLYPLIHKFSNNSLMAENFEILNKDKFATLKYNFPRININDPIVILFNAFIGDLIKADVIHKDVSVNLNTCIREVVVIDNIYYMFGNYIRRKLEE